MSAYTPLFNSNDFFEGLLRGAPLPSWEEARVHIHDLFFSQLRHHLQSRVRCHIPDITIRPLLLTDSNGQPLTRYEKRHLPFVTEHYLSVCSDLKMMIKQIQRSDELHKFKYGLYYLQRETDRLQKLLTIIGRIFESTQPKESKKSSKSKQLPTTKTLLELKKDRKKVLSSSSDLPTESQNDKMESKKKNEMQSSDEDDFDSYFEEIRSLASSISDDESTSEREWKPLSHYGLSAPKICDYEKFNAVCESVLSLEEVNQNFSECSSSSSTVDTNVFPFSYQTISNRLMEEKQQMEMDILTNKIIDEMNSNIAGCLNLFL